MQRTSRAGHHDTSKMSLLCLSLAIFGLCLYVRTPNLLLHPRIWAEEGSFYLKDIQYLDIVNGTFFIVNSNLQILTNLIVESTLLFPVKFTAYVTTYASFFLSLLMMGLICIYMRSKGCGILPIASAAVIIALQISGHEIYLNTTNVQWMCSVGTLLIVALDDVPAIAPAGIARYILVLIFGLTGVTSDVLLPVTVLSFALRPSRYRLALTLILLATTLLQIAIILTHRISADRQFHFSIAYGVPFAIQTVGAFIAPIRDLDAVGAASSGASLAAFGARIQLILIGIAAWVGLGFWAVRRFGAFSASILVLGAVSASFVNLFGSFGGVEGEFSGWAGGRYLFLGQVVVAIVVTSGLSSQARTERWISAGLVILGFVNASITTWSFQPPATSIAGPDFASQVDQCVRDEPCQVKGWPLDPKWAFTIPADRMR